MKLSDVRNIFSRPKTRVVLHDNRTEEGAAAGLDEVPVQLGDQSVTVNLAKAVEVRATPLVDTEVVWYTLRARQEDKEILGHSESLLVQGLLTGPTFEAVEADIKPPTLTGDKVERKLSSAIADVAVGGGGRYLVLHLPRERKLAVFDVNAAKVVGD